MLMKRRHSSMTVSARHTWLLQPLLALVTGQAAPPYFGDRVMLRERTDAPPPQALLHEPQPPQPETTQWTGHGCVLQVVVDVRPVAAQGNLKTEPYLDLQVPAHSLTANVGFLDGLQLALTELTLHHVPLEYFCFRVSLQPPHALPPYAGCSIE